MYALPQLLISWIVAASVIVVMPSTVDAQTSDSRDSTRASFSIGAMRVMSGYTGFNRDELNERLTAAGLPRVHNGVASVGFGSELRFGRTMFGGTVQTMLSRAGENAVYRSNVSGTMAMLDAAMSIVATQHTALYPIVGVGASHTSMRVKPRDGVDFEDGLANPERGMTMTGTVFLYQAGLGAERRFDGARPFALIARAGILRNVGDQRWAVDGEHAAGGPRGLRGAYAQIAIATPLRGRRDALVSLGGAFMRAAH